MNLVTSPHEFLHHPSLPEPWECNSGRGEALETDLVKSWSRSTKKWCLPSRVFAKGFAVVSRVLQIGILRSELILSGHVLKSL